MANYIKGNGVTNATSYTLHKKSSTDSAVVDAAIATQTVSAGGAISFNLDELVEAGTLPSGSYQFAVKAHADGYLSSDYSELSEPEFVVESVYNWVKMTDYAIKTTAISSVGTAISGVTDVVRHNFNVAVGGTYKATGAYSIGVGIVCFSSSSAVLAYYEPSSPFANYEFNVPSGTAVVAVAGTSSVTPELYLLAEGENANQGDASQATIVADTPTIKTGTYLDAGGGASITDANAIRYNYMNMPAGTYFASGYYPSATGCVAIVTFDPIANAKINAYSPGIDTFTDIMFITSETTNISVAGSTSVTPVLKKL